jgi:hypothetical protein
MIYAAHNTVYRRLAVAICLLGGLAGCQADRTWPVRHTVNGCSADAACPGECGRTCAACSPYQPTVWGSWQFGPMAVRGGCDSSAQGDPDWLGLGSDSTAPGPLPLRERAKAKAVDGNERPFSDDPNHRTSRVAPSADGRGKLSEPVPSDWPPAKAAGKPAPDAIPLPPADPDKRADPHSETGSKPLSQADVTPADFGKAGAMPALAEELKPQREASPAENSGETAKLAFPGLETPVEKPSSAADRDALPPPLKIPDNQ